MALMKCPECGGQVSNQARNCPHCGFPIADAVTPAPAAMPMTTPAAATVVTPSTTTTARPLRSGNKLNGILQRVSWPFVLFWGGMIIGVMGTPNLVKNIQAGGVASGERTLMGTVGWVMIFAGIGLFLYNEIRDFRRRQAEELEADRQALAAEQAAKQHSDAPPTS